MQKRSGRILIFLGILLIASQAVVGAVCQQEDQEASVWKKQFPLISESDLHCSFSVLEEDPVASIIGMERAEDRMLLREGDVVFLDIGTSSGAEVGQKYQMLDIVKHLGGFGPLALKKGWIRITQTKEDQSKAVVERLCGSVQIGTRLIPYEEVEEITGQDLGFDVEFDELQGADGKFLYFQQDYVQMGKGHLALINLGREDGLDVGHQLAVYRSEKKNIQVVIANAIVIDVQSKSATVKILSCKDVIRDGDRIKGRI